MSEQPPTAYAPPGWYPDPTGLEVQRWWDGTQWGQQTRPLAGRGQESQPQYLPQQPYGQQPRQPSFTPDPQYSTPPGQPPYQAQPYGPPDQPPYPGPGYGYGPQQPRRRRKRHWVRNILAGIGAVVVAGIAITAISSHGSGVSTTPSGNSGTSSATASPAGPAKIGSYFDVGDSSGDTYRVTLVKIIDPAQGADEFNTPDSGKRFVGTVFKIKALKGSPQNEDANNDAAVIGSNGQTYNADLGDIAGYTNFSNGSINVAQGDTTTGAVTFQLPDGIKLTQVQWTAASGFGSTVQWDVRG